MGQSESSSTVEMPKRSLSVEFFVGIFSLITVAAAGYLSVGLGGLEIGGSDTYFVKAEFDNVAGLDVGSPIELAGVPVGEVWDISLKDPVAVVTIRLESSFQIRDDDILSVRTKGIVGDRYLKISRGASDVFIGEGDVITETESAVEIEDIIGKIVHSMGADEEEDDDI